MSEEESVAWDAMIEAALPQVTRDHQGPLSFFDALYEAVGNVESAKCVSRSIWYETFLTFVSQSNFTQPMLKLRFTSLVVSDSAAKETRIKVTLCGLTYTLYPDLTWASEVAQFVKAPPGVGQYTLLT